MYAIVDNGPRDTHRSAESRAEVAKDLRVGRGQTLFFDDDPAEFFFEIVGGTVRCCPLIHDGRRQIFRFAGAGEMIGLSCEDAYGYSTEAVTDVIVRRHRLGGLDGAMMADADLRRRVLQALRDELAAMRTQVMLLGRMSAAEKLASFLLKLAGERQPAGCIELPMTRSDIADYLGLTIETVSRKLRELGTLGVIRLETPSRVRITDYDRIEAIAEAA